MKYMDSVGETPNNLPPPSYKPADDTTLSIEKKPAFDPYLATGCPCHVRYHALASSIDSIYASYLSLPADVQKKYCTTWTLGRIKALLGIIRTPTSPCTERCECHEEYLILKKKIEEDEKGTSAIRGQIKSSGLDKINSFEKWFGEVHYLHGMLRVCAVKGRR